MSSKIMAFVFLLAPLFLINRKKEELKVEHYGKIVQMRIVEKPSSCLGTKVKWSMKVEYQGVIRAIRISGNYCEEHNIGDMVPIKVLKGSDIILMPNTSTIGEFVAMFLLSSFGLGWLIYEIRNKK